MGFRGRVPLGGEVFVGCLCVDKNQTPFAPDACPTMDVYSVAGRVLTKQIPAVDPTVVPGLFGYRLFLNSPFGVGRYRVRYRYTHGGLNYLDMDEFEALPGNTNGAVISEYAYLKPGNNYLIQQLDSGVLVRGRKPRIDQGLPGGTVFIATDRWPR
jgi:hypothetical protein